jgi:hypothetical protein
MFGNEKSGCIFAALFEPRKGTFVEILKKKVNANALGKLTIPRLINLETFLKSNLLWRV